MVFDFFKKKKEVVDLRPKDSDMPVPAKMKEKLLAGNSNLSSAPASNATTSTSSGSSGGGFFSFFGGGGGSSNSSSSDSSASSTTPASTPNSNTSTQTDFWGNPVNTNNPSASASSSSSTSSQTQNESQVNDLIYRLSRLTDRVELLEKKIDRTERKLGIGESGY